MAAPLWLLGGTIPSSARGGSRRLPAMLFFAGQVFTLLALSTGDVSVATPVLGVKILLVALLTAVLIGDPIGARLWTAAALSTTAIALLNISRGACPQARRHHDSARCARRHRIRVLRRAGPEVVARVGNRPDRADRDGVRGRVFNPAAPLRRAPRRASSRGTVARLHLVARRRRRCFSRRKG